MLQATAGAKKKAESQAKLRAVQDAKKKKEEKVKALSNRIAWLQAEEERTTLKVGELRSLIQVAEEKRDKAGVKSAPSSVRMPSSIAPDPEDAAAVAKLARDVAFKGVLEQGRDQAHRSKQRVKQAKKEHGKLVRSLPKKKKAAEAAGRPGRHEVPAGAEDLQITLAAEVVEEAGAMAAGPSTSVGGLSRAQAKQRELENAAPAGGQGQALSALELISRRWNGSKQPLRENMEITRRQIMSHKHRTSLLKADPSSEIKMFEYSGGAWRKPLTSA